MLVANLSRVKLISQNDVDILYWLRNQFCEPKPIIDIVKLRQGSGKERQGKARMAKGERP